MVNIVDDVQLNITDSSSDVWTIWYMFVVRNSKYMYGYIIRS